MTKYFLVLLILGFALPALGDELTLKDLINKAMLSSLEVKASREENQIEELSHKNNVAAFLPSLDLKTAHGIQKSLPESDLKTDSNPWASEMSLSLKENLYDNGISLKNYDTGKIKRQIAGLRLEQKREEIVLAVTEAYYEYSLNQQLILANRELEKTLSNQFRLAEGQYRQGLKARNDFLRFQGELQRAQMEGLDLGNKQRELLEKIGQLVYEPRENLQIAVLNPLTAPPPILPEQAIKLDQTKEAKIFELTKQVNANNIDLVERKNLPQVNLTSQVSWGANNYMGTGNPVYSTDQTNWSTMLSLDYNILDFGTRRREVAIAVAQKNASEFRAEDKLKELERTLLTAKDDMVVFAKRVELAKKLLKSEEESYRLLSSEYNQGRVSYLELVEGLGNLNDGRASYFRATFSLLTQLARYRFYEGSIDAADPK